MGRIKTALKNFFVPPPGSRLWRRLMPFGFGLLAFVGLFFAGGYVWDYTNSPSFCGTSCHTMPPEYAAYLTSPHARILCVECHIGRDFIGSRVLRKAGDLKHVVAMTFGSYTYPIFTDAMRPARETCEQCHSPDKFSNDTLVEINRYANDLNNTATSTFLTLKTGGGNKRQGLGKGIHWHVESQVYYSSTDKLEQTIPYVRVVDDDGSITEYVDSTSGLDPKTIDPKNLIEMDCITCHNRITHMILSPSDTVDQLMERKVIDADIPEIHLKATQVFTDYTSVDAGLAAIDGLQDYYQRVHTDYIKLNPGKVEAAIAALKDAFQKSYFPDQKEDWQTHPSNVGHKDTPGCFRCHDGKHLDSQQQAIRLECNLCHSIPVVVGPNKFIADIEISRGAEPQSHLNANWIGQHPAAFNPQVCSKCHSISNAGGTDNSSFCSNSACHANNWQYAGLNAPGLRDVFKSQLPPQPTPAPLPVNGPLTYDATVGPIFRSYCSDCHSDGGMKNLNLTTYQSALTGGDDGAVIVPGNPDASLLVKKQSGPESHFGQLPADLLSLVVNWIKAGAPEK
jgi:nitrate/TMAO reductase-like tetraheme cytochrome c subunit